MENHVADKLKSKIGISILLFSKSFPFSFKRNTNKGYQLRMERLELSRTSSPDSKSGASTNYATSAITEFKSPKLTIVHNEVACQFFYLRRIHYNKYSNT